MKARSIFLINFYVMSLLGILYLMYSIEKNGLPRPVVELLGFEATKQQLHIKATRSQ